MATKKTSEYPSNEELFLRLVIGLSIAIVVFFLVLWGLWSIFGPVFDFIGRYIALSWIWKLIVLITITWLLLKAFKLIKSRASTTTSSISSSATNFFSSFWTWFSKTGWKLAALILLALWLIPRYKHDDYGSRPHVQTTNNAEHFAEQEITITMGNPFKFTKLGHKKYTFYCNNGMRTISLNPVGDDDHYISGVIDKSGFRKISGEDYPDITGPYMAIIDSTATVTMRITDVP